MSNWRAVVLEEQLVVIYSSPRFQVTIESKLTCEDRDRARTQLDNTVLMSLGRVLIDAVDPGLGD